jgi:hypothetical protein
MTKKIIKYYIVLLVIFFSWVNLAHANLEITQVMYNPTVKTDHLWIKVYNNDSNDINLKEYYVMDYDGTSWHYHAINTDDSPILAPNSYAIIAKSSSTNIDVFKNKNPDISDPLFYGNLTIENEGILGLSKVVDKKTIISQISYGGDTAIPIVSSSDEDLTTDTENSDSSSTNSTSSSSSSSKVVPAVLKITTKIISPKIVVEGIPFHLNSLTTTNKGETYAVGKFVWNFGDGMKREVNKSSQFDYIYDYPGEYVLTLSYFDNSFNEIADATDRLIIKVIPSDIYISSVGNDIDPYIELENKSKYEVVLSGWIVTGGEHSFVFPEGTTIMQGSKIKLSPKITRFTGDDLKYIVITNPNKEIITTYPIEKKNIVYKNSPISSVASKDSNTINNNLKDIPLLKDPQIINLNDLSANAEDAKIDVSNGVYPFIGLLVIIILGIVSFLFIKKKNKTKDYVGEEIRPEDMTIIE